VKQVHGALRPALMDIAQQWAQFAGWLCSDAGDVSGARACYGQALEWAIETGDETMTATMDGDSQVPVAVVRLTSRGGDDAAHVSPGQAVEHQVDSPESRQHRWRDDPYRRTEPAGIGRRPGSHSASPEIFFPFSVARLPQLRRVSSYVAAPRRPNQSEIERLYPAGMASPRTSAKVNRPARLCSLLTSGGAVLVTWQP